MLKGEIPIISAKCQDNSSPESHQMRAGNEYSPENEESCSKLGFKFCCCQNAKFSLKILSQYLNVQLVCTYHCDRFNYEIRNWSGWNVHQPSSLLKSMAINCVDNKNIFWKFLFSFLLQLSMKVRLNIKCDFKQLNQIRLHHRSNLT